MGTYYLPRETKGEGRILYIFSTKALIYTVGGLLIGAVFRWVLNLFGKAIPAIASVMNIIGIVLMVLLAVIGFVITTVKVPSIDRFEITKKASGIEMDKVITEYIRFHFKKDKYYVFDTKDLIREQLEKEEEEKEKERKEKEKEMKKQMRKGNR